MHTHTCTQRHIHTHHHQGYVSGTLVASHTHKYTPPPRVRFCYFRGECLCACASRLGTLFYPPFSPCPLAHLHSAAASPRVPPKSWFSTSMELKHFLSVYVKSILKELPETASLKQSLAVHIKKFPYRACSLLLVLRLCRARSHHSTHTYEWVMARMNEPWHIWMSHSTYVWVMAQMNELRHTVARALTPPCIPTLTPPYIPTVNAQGIWYMFGTHTQFFF